MKKISENTIASKPLATIVKGMQLAKPAYKSLIDAPIIPAIKPISGPK